MFKESGDRGQEERKGDRFEITQLAGKSVLLMGGSENRGRWISLYRAGDWCHSECERGGLRPAVRRLIRVGHWLHSRNDAGHG